MPDRNETLSLPIVDAAENGPVPLVLRVTANYWGVDVRSGDKTSTTRGDDFFVGLKYLKSQGLISYIYEGSMAGLKKKIDQKIPPIVILPGINDIVQHANVISGYAASDRRIITYVPEPDTIGAIPESRFEELWSEENHVNIVVVPEELRNIVERDELKHKSSCELYFECDSMWQQGKREEALDRLRRASQPDKEYPLNSYLLGSLYSQFGSSEAVNCFESAIRTNPRYFLAYRGLGNYFLKKKEYRKADENYTKAITVNPQRFAPIYKNRALCRIELGNKEAAKDDLAMYLKYLPGALDADAVRSGMEQL